MPLVIRIKPIILQGLNDLYKQSFTDKDISLNITKPEFEGDYTIVLFSFVKHLKKSPEQIGRELGAWLVEKNPDLFKNYNVIKGFLNLTIADDYWIDFLQENYGNPNFPVKPPKGVRIMVEYSSPNTNKPLHLGHLRNNFLGWSVAQILKANGYEVIKTCIVNDRGIHICKSMLAWQKYANGATPQSTNTKGDHFVGEYYVMFETELKKQAEPIIDRLFRNDLTGIEGEDADQLKKLLQALADLKKDDDEKIEKIKEEIKEIARNHTPIMKEAKEMLRKWEAGDKEVYALWQRMNAWVYEGFAVTYKRIGSDFDKIYYESETYLPGKKFVEEGLEKGVLFRKDDGSVWIDLTKEGLDQKLVLRKDGTSVYITQDLGLAQQKYEDFNYDQSIYVVGDEQNHYFKVLKLILQKLGVSYADSIHHLSYGMVELPSGKMKSREGTVVDADDILDEMINESRKKTKEQGKLDTEEFSGPELQDLYEVIGIGGLKFFLLRVDPKKRIIFNPEESIDLHGFTATFIQYAHARIKSILREETAVGKGDYSNGLLPLEKELLITLEQYPAILEQACTEKNPSVIAIYAFTIAQVFNSFYSQHKVLKAETDKKKQLRLQLCEMTANTLSSAMGLLGIKVPERM
jgi:arginyl-tRNA synthetase